MSQPSKFRATLQGEFLEIRVQLMHEMETGNRKDAGGQLVPAHFIQSVEIRLNDKPILNAQCGTAISKNPFFVFRVRGGRKGDRLEVSWVDNRGDKRVDEAIV